MPKKNNFSDIEVDILCNLIDKYKNIIANKQTNVVFNKKKEETWNKITIEFNAATGMNNRTVTQLQNKYKNMKKNAQKNKAADRMAFFATGGGSSYLKTTPVEEKLIAIGVVTEPIENDFDCDAEFSKRIKENQGMTVIETNTGQNNIEGECHNFDIYYQEPETDQLGREHGIEREENMPAGETDMGTQESEATASTSAPPKKLPLIRGSTPKRKPNASQKAADAMVDGARAREKAIEQESIIRNQEHLLRMEREETEHKARMEREQTEHEVRMEAEYLKMKIDKARLQNEEQKFKVLLAKEKYYKNLKHNNA